MATITTLAGGEIPSVGSGPDNSIDTIITATGSVFTWTSPDGNRITLIGTFVYGGGTGAAPTSGTVSEMRYDHGDNGSDDMTVDYGGLPIAVDPDMFAANSITWSNPWFQGNDTFQLDGTVFATIPIFARFAADGGSDSNVMGSDMLTITGAGTYVADVSAANNDGFVAPSDTITVNSTLGVVKVSGDIDSLNTNNSGLNRTLTFGDDVMDDNSPNSALEHILIGDIITGSSIGSNYILNTGSDTITGKFNSVRIVGDVEEIEGDFITLNGGADIITGSDQADFLIGDLDFFRPTVATSNQVNGGNDTINGAEGNDTIVGDVRELSSSNVLAGGDDTIDGGEGNDTIYGDYETALAGSTIISGGDDDLSGGDGNDMLFGQEGNDTLEGGAGNDTLDGGAGTDTASYENATLGVNVSLRQQGVAQSTNLGLDTLESIENLTGGAFADRLSGDSGDNVLDGGANFDFVTYEDASAGVNVSLALQGSSQNTIGDGNDLLIGFENLVGSAFNDTLTGDSSGNTIEGGDGNDTMDGGASSDILSYRLSSAGVTVDLSLQGIAQNTGGAGIDTISNFENLSGSDFADNLTGDAGANSILAFNGNDTINAGAGQDNVSGGVGDDTFIDTENGASGNTDIYNGGTGIDTLVATSIAWSNITEFNLTTGFQTVSGGIQRDQLIDIENLTISGNATLTGDAENNVLTADDSQGAGNNSINGMNGNDTIVGGLGDDTLNGGDGDDTIFGGTGLVDNVNSGVDTINGGAGNDTVIYSRTSSGTLDVDSNDGGDDIDTFVLQNIIGTRLVDLALGAWTTGNINVQGSVRGTLVNFENVTVSGDVHVRGDAGNNVITATDPTGTNFIEGGLGDDTLDGGGGTDTAIFSGDFEDYTFTAISGGFTISGLDGTDTVLNFENFQFDDITVSATVLATPQIRGTSNPDTLGGTAGDDVILGLEDDDNISALGGNDIVFGGDGDDTINASNGGDTLIGGSGDDTLIGGAGGDVIDGGSNTGVGDTASYSNSNAAVNVNLGADTASGGHATGDDLNDIENLFGSVHADTLTGDGSANTINGFNGNDTIDGGGGDDELIGGNGNDTFISGSGADDMNGGSGAGDTADYSGSGSGVDVGVDNAAVNIGGDAQGDSLLGIENLIGTNFDDTLTGNTTRNNIQGGTGDDTISSSSNVDTVNGGAGDDLIIGGRGADILDGGTNTAAGDTVSYSNSDLRVTVDLDTGGGTGSATGSGHGTGDVLTNFENIFGSRFNDSLTGDSGNNEINGFLGNDDIFGEGGNDNLLGGSGNDNINGGTGNDTMMGGAGLDTFIYTTLAFGQDTITGWQNGSDMLDFTALGLDENGFTITQDGADTLITLNSDNAQTVRLAGINANTINGNDFVDLPAAPIRVPDTVTTPEPPEEDGGGYRASDPVQTLSGSEQGGYGTAEREIETLSIDGNGGYLASDPIEALVLNELANGGGYLASDDGIETLSGNEQGGFWTGDPVQTLSGNEQGGYGTAEREIETLSIDGNGGYRASDDIIDTLSADGHGGYLVSDATIVTLAIDDPGGYLVPDTDDSEFAFIM